MSEPEFIFQTAEPMTDRQRIEWLGARSREARAEGATWGRASIKENLLLYEGWKVRPDDEGAPRFQYGGADATPAR